jgi:hypothetical protein
MFDPCLSDITKSIKLSDSDQILGYAKSIGIRAPDVLRLPIDQKPNGLISGLVFGQDPSLVFLHGGQLNAHTWDGVILSLIHI